MRFSTTRVLAVGVAAIAIGIYAESGVSGRKRSEASNDPVAIAVEKGVKWLVSVQGKDGGWGQDGGETSYVRQGERLESNGNDVANTAVAVTALLEAGKQYQSNVDRALDFILRKVESSPADGLAI